MHKTPVQNLFTHFLGEFLGSFVLAAFVYGAIEIYNAAMSEIDENKNVILLPPTTPPTPYQIFQPMNYVIYGIIIYMGEYSVRYVLSMIFGRPVELTPHVTAVRTGMQLKFANFKRADNVDTSGFFSVGEVVLRLLLSFVAQISGNISGGIVAYALGGNTIAYASMSVGVPSATSATVWRVFVLEGLGALLLGVMAFMALRAYDVTTSLRNMDAREYSHSLAIVSASYTVVAWARTHGSLDPFREGAFCLWAYVAPDDSNAAACSAIGDMFQASLYVFVMCMHIGLAALFTGLAYVVYTRSMYTRHSEIARVRPPSSAPPPSALPPSAPSDGKIDMQGETYILRRRNRK